MLQTRKQRELSMHFWETRSKTQQVLKTPDATRWVHKHNLSSCTQKRNNKKWLPSNKISRTKYVAHLNTSLGHQGTPIKIFFVPTHISQW
jgi:hypothetical protein